MPLKSIMRLILRVLGGLHRLPKLNNLRLMQRNRARSIDDDDAIKQSRRFAGVREAGGRGRPAHQGGTRFNGTKSAIIEADGHTPSVAWVVPG